MMDAPEQDGLLIIGNLFPSRMVGEESNTFAILDGFVQHPFNANFIQEGFEFDKIVSI
jgi:hypothetical protein